MILTAHILAGAAIGEEIQNPYWAFFIGLASHLLFDTLPHTDTTETFKNDRAINILIVIDAILICILFLFFYTKIILTTSIISGIFGATIIDLIDNSPLWKKQVRATKWGGVLHRFHLKIHHIIPDIILPFSLIIEIIIIGGLICGLLKF